MFAETLQGEKHNSQMSLEVCKTKPAGLILIEICVSAKFKHDYMKNYFTAENIQKYIFLVKMHECWGREMFLREVIQ